MNRRDVIKLMGGSTLLGSFGLSQSSVAETVRTLRAFPSTKRLVPDSSFQEANIWGFEGKVPGPELRFKKGEWVRVEFENELPEGSSIHWHGIRNLNGMDGVAGLTQPAVEPGDRFRYVFPLPDSGTYWYHSHAKTWSQVARGLYGPLIVEDPEDPEVDHDLVLMIDDWRLADDGTLEESSFGSLHDWAHAGRLGNWLTVNGESHPNIPVKQNARVRLRLINAANARVFGIALPTEGTLIAEDGFPRTHQLVNDITLAPAQRADVIWEMDSETTTFYEVRNGEPYPAFTLTPVESSEPRVAKRPLSQKPVAPPPDRIDVEIPLHMQGGAMGNLSEAVYHGKMTPIRELAQMHKKVWAFNGQVGDHHDALATLSRNQVASIEVFNDTRWEHAMHLHGHHFWIQTEQGEFLNGQRDTYLFSRGERAKLIFVADNPGLWLFHCHMLEHHEAGMVAVIEVV